VAVRARGDPSEAGAVVVEEIARGEPLGHDHRRLPRAHAVGHDPGVDAFGRGSGEGGAAVATLKRDVRALVLRVVLDGRSDEVDGATPLDTSGGSVDLEVERSDEVG